jgi:hypothetical protein
VQANEWPQALQDHLLVTHICNRVNQAYAVERESNVVTLSSCHV